MLPSVSSTFTFLVIPDTQNLSKHHPDVFASMTRWIARHAEDLSILLVAPLGDVVDGGGRKVEEYLAASSALETIYEAGIPLLIAPGNHDYDLPIISSSKWDADSNLRALSMFNHYFGLHRVQHQPWFGGEFELGKAENMYAQFEVHGAKLLVLILEFRPRDEVLTWANTIIGDHADQQVFILTHCYMYMNGERTRPGDDANPKKYVATANGNDGEAFGRKL